MKPKNKISIDELLKSVETKKTSELMSPVKPLKRQLHIEILNWKNNDIKESLAIKPKDVISKMIVEFNVANREILKIKKIKGQLIDTYGFLRMKEMCSLHGYSSSQMNTILNRIFPECKMNGVNVDYWKTLERIYILKHDTNMVKHDIAVVGILFKNQIDKTTNKIINYSGDIVRFAMVDSSEKAIKETLSRIQTYFIGKLPMIRLVRNKGTMIWIDTIYDDGLARYGWYRSHGANDRATAGSLDGYFPKNIILKYGCNIEDSFVRLSDEAKRFYIQPTRRIRPSTRIDMTRLRHEVTRDLQDSINDEVEHMQGEGYSEEYINNRIDYMVDEEMERRLEARREEVEEPEETVSEILRRNIGEYSIEDVNDGSKILPVGTNVIVEHGNAQSRSPRLSNGRERCRITGVRTEENRRDYAGFDYEAKFSDGNTWYIKADEIIEIEGIMRRYTGGALIIGTVVLVRHGNNWSRTGLSSGRQRCRIIEVIRGETRVKYRVEFANGSRWFIRPSEITDILLGNDGVEATVEEMLSERRRRREGTTPNTSTERNEDNLRLPVGTRVIIRHGSGYNRVGLNDGIQECRIIEDLNVDYNAEFPNGQTWYIKANEIVRVLDSE